MEINDLIGITWKLDGKTKDGMDCIGLVEEVYRRLGKNLPDYQCPGIELSNIDKTIKENESNYIQLEKVEPWCLVTFSLIRPYTTHIGVVLEDGVSFLHVQVKTRSCIIRLDNPIWSRRITGFWKIK
jgi:cell wall-associated NlpC family hydrolase